MDERKRSGKIPAFGDWEKANEMPITQYFESARQAGLLRRGDVGFRKSSQDLGPPSTKMTRGRGRERRLMSSEQKKQGKVYDVTEPITARKQSFSNAPKPVDEDLYKIPPHLLHSSKSKKLPGFFSCLVPGCAL